MIRLNTPDGEILWNIKQSLLRKVKQVSAYPPNDKEIALVAGGPSLEDTFDELTDLMLTKGVKPVCMNGTHDYLLDRGIRPSAMVVCDARSLNVKYVTRPQEKTKYFLASQCNPAVYDALDGYDVYQFHLLQGIGERKLVGKERGLVPWIVGGCTVGLRTIHLMRVLGFCKMHIFGMDSCRLNGKHHAYKQTQNDYRETQEFTIGDRTFVFDHWGLAQMEGFVNMTKSLGDLFELKFYGDGAIAHLVNTIAETGINPLEGQAHGRECVGLL